MKKLTNSSAKAAMCIKQGYDHVGQRSYVFVKTTVAAAVAATTPSLSHAAKTIGDIGTNVGDQATGLTEGALRISGFIGIVMVIVALIKGRASQKQGDSIGTAVSMGVIGALLLAIAAIITIVNTSILGTDASAGIQGQIIGK